MGHPLQQKRGQAGRLLAGVAAALSLGLAGGAGAVVVAGNPNQDAPANTAAPGGFEDAWARIGRIGGGSGVYLGNGYVLSARHVNGGSSFTVDGFSHSRIAGTSVTLSNPASPGVSAESDLWINRYAVPDTSPLQGLGVLALNQATITGGGINGKMIGLGYGHEDPAASDISESGDGSPRGYVWADRWVKRWGDVRLSSGNFAFGADGRDIVDGLASTSLAEIAGRGNAAKGDSGGGLFLSGPDGPVLAGIIHVINGLAADQLEDTTAINHNITGFSDLTVYSDQIHVAQGDLTGDGFVGVEDLDLILANWGDTVTRGDWTLGDANGDGQVGQADLQHVIDHYAGAGGLASGVSLGSPGAGGSAVPEPGTLGLLVILGAIGPRRRRRDAHRGHGNRVISKMNH